MNRRIRVGVFVPIVILVLAVSGITSLLAIRTGLVASEASFSFAAAGDLGNTTQPTTRASLQALAGLSIDFFVALGDMSYMNPGTEGQWCDYVHTFVPLGFPFELVSGNHEAGSATAPGPNGYIGNFAACLLDNINGLSYENGYAKEYYFDYPKSSPLVRIILIGADLTIDGIQYYYSIGGQRYSWLSNTIDNARSSGVKWVIVGMHKDCITMGRKTCEIGSDLMNLLIQKRVDLVLEGHDHNYQRGKQLICAEVNHYSSHCVANDGSDNAYPRGAGTIFIIQGSFGRSLDIVNASDSEAAYFAKAWGGNGYWTGGGSSLEPKKGSYGFMKYTISQTEISAQFVNTTGTFTDRFTVTAELVGTSTSPWSLLVATLQSPVAWIVIGSSVTVLIITMAKASSRRRPRRANSSHESQSSYEVRFRRE